MPEISINSHNGNLSKEWRIQWYEGTKRIKKTQGINKFNTVFDWTKAAEALKAYWLEKLSKNTKGIKGTMYQKQSTAIADLFDQLKLTWRKKSIQTHHSRL